MSKNLNVNQIRLKTNNRSLNAKIVGNLMVELEMGKPLFNFEDIPLSKTVNPADVSLNVQGEKFTGGFCLNVGNPHIVFFVDDCFKYDLKEIGPLIENHELFPEKTNVTLAQILDKRNILVNVWERGAGLTKACGTAACATAVAGKNKKLVENKVAIKFKEGILNIVLDEKNNIFMTGPVSEIKNIKVEI